MPNPINDGRLHKHITSIGFVCLIVIDSKYQHASKLALNQVKWCLLHGCANAGIVYTNYSSARHKKLCCSSEGLLLPYHTSFNFLGLHSVGSIISCQWNIFINLMQKFVQLFHSQTFLWGVDFIMGGNKGGSKPSNTGGNAAAGNVQGGKNPNKTLHNIQYNANSEDGGYINSVWDFSSKC